MFGGANLSFSWGCRFWHLDWRSRFASLIGQQGLASAYDNIHIDDHYSQYFRSIWFRSPRRRRHISLTAQRARSAPEVSRPLAQRLGWGRSSDRGSRIGRSAFAGPVCGCGFRALWRGGDCSVSARAAKPAARSPDLPQLKITDKRIRLFCFWALRSPPLALR